MRQIYATQKKQQTHTQAHTRTINNNILFESGCLTTNTNISFLSFFFCFTIVIVLFLLIHSIEYTVNL